MPHHHPYPPHGLEPHHGPLHGDRRPPRPADPIVVVLRKLADHDRMEDVAALVECARRLMRHGAAKILEEIAQEFSSPPVELALDALEVKLQLTAHNAKSQLLSKAVDKSIALIFPLPRHVHEGWLEIPGARILLPSHHPIPPHLEHANVPIIDGTRACRRAIGAFDLVVVEGHCGIDGEFVGDAEAADIVHRSLVSNNSALFLHVRPHRHDDDVPFEIDGTRFSFI